MCNANYSTCPKNIKRFISFRCDLYYGEDVHKINLTGIPTIIAEWGGAGYLIQQYNTQTAINAYHPITFNFGQTVNEAFLIIIALLPIEFVKQLVQNNTWLNQIHSAS